MLQLMCGLFSGFVAAGDVRFEDTEKTYQSMCICYPLLTLTSWALSDIGREGRERRVGLCFSCFSLSAECSLLHRMLQPRGLGVDAKHSLLCAEQHARAVQQGLVWSSFLMAPGTARMRTVTTADLIDTYCPRVCRHSLTWAESRY